MLASHLAPRALVVVDDGAREDEMKMVEMWGELDGVGFEKETLDFLPHAPMLLTMGGEGRVAELRLAREERSDDEEEDVECVQAKDGEAERRSAPT